MTPYLFPDMAYLVYTNPYILCKSLIFARPYGKNLEFASVLSVRIESLTFTHVQEGV
jgi:hypothetical protein